MNKHGTFFCLSLALLLICSFGNADSRTIHVGEGQKYVTLAAALSKVKDRDLEIIVHGTVNERSTISIVDRRVLLRGSGSAKIQLSNMHFRQCDITLGDGENLLQMTGSIDARNSSIHSMDGITLQSETVALSLQECTVDFQGGEYYGKTTGVALTECDARIESGRFEGDTALFVDKSYVSEIAGGEFISSGTQAIFLSRTHVGEISGGHIVKHGDKKMVSRAALYIDHETVIDLITAGDFIAESGSGMLLIRGAHIGKISGGTFQSLSENSELAFCHHGVTILSGGDGYETGIDCIEGGTFCSSGAERSYGLLAYCNAAGMVYIGNISGEALFQGSSGLVLTNAHSKGTAAIETIQGGEFYAVNEPDSPVYADAALGIYSGSIQTIIDGTFLSKRNYASALLLDAACFLDTEEVGEGGSVGDICGGRYISTGIGSAVMLGEATSQLRCISDGYFYGNTAVISGSVEPVTIDGGTYFSTGKICICEVNPEGQMLLEPSLAKEMGKARFMVEGYLMEGVQDKHLFQSVCDGQFVYPTIEGTEGTYVISNDGVIANEQEALTRDILFRYLTAIF